MLDFEHAHLLLPDGVSVKGKKGMCTLLLSSLSTRASGRETASSGLLGKVPMGDDVALAEVLEDLFEG